MQDWDPWWFESGIAGSQQRDDLDARTYRLGTASGLSVFTI
jgi:hypothetical protein